MSPRLPVRELSQCVGQEVGISGWLTMDQTRIDRFAEVTEDEQFIHTDAELASKTPFGGTIAHGFLTLSLLSRMAVDGAIAVAGVTMAINYGFDKIRFLSPVATGSRVRGRFVLDETRERAPGEILLRYRVTVEIEGQDKPALIANWLTLQILD